MHAYAEWMADTHGVSFVKGHGTQNDFVIIPDAAAGLDLSASLVAAICDRRAGIGADGVLRVVAVSSSEAADSAHTAKWFMDYRNADGSVAEMCGNGARVFARFLADEGWETSDSFVIATRAGEHHVQVMPNGDISVDMGLPRQGRDGPDPEVNVDGALVSADAWWLPNPHAVVFVDSLEALDYPLPQPEIDDHGRFPAGQNVEYVRDLSVEGSLHAAVRVHERGVGETRSCGTGACAVSLSLRKLHGVEAPATSIVDVSGGRLSVKHAADGRIDLIGPAEVVARGTLDKTWWENAG